MAAKKGGLGKGLDAIFSENDMEDQNSAVAIKISEIEPNRAQPRKDFDEESLAELADSISEHGVLQPILVRPLIGGGYQIVAGERRWRAARMAGVQEIPAVVRDLSESQVMELALIENLQREDLNPLEEAGGYSALIETYGFTQEEVARTVGRSRPAVANALRLLTLPESVRDMVERGELSAGHARTLLAIGLPMGLQFSITAIGSIMLQSANNALGSACVAAFTAGVRIKMFVISPFESLGMAMATYTGHNYGAVKPERIWQGIKVAAGLMLGYALFAFVVLMAGSDLLARLFIDPSQSEILADTRLFLHVASYFLPVLGLLCILRYTIQGAGYTNLAMLSGVSEMIARTAVSLWAVPALGYIAVCFGDPTAWIAADLFLVPAFVYVYGRLKRMTPPEKPIGGR